MRSCTATTTGKLHLNVCRYSGGMTNSKRRSQAKARHAENTTAWNENRISTRAEARRMRSVSTIPERSEPVTSEFPSTTESKSRQSYRYVSSRRSNPPSIGSGPRTQLVVVQTDDATGHYAALCAGAGVLGALAGQAGRHAGRSGRGPDGVGGGRCIHGVG